MMSNSGFIIPFIQLSVCLLFGFFSKSITSILTILSTAFYKVEIIYERFIAKPIAQHFNLKENNVYKFVPNPQLEVYYKNKNELSQSLYMVILSSQLKNTLESIKQLRLFM